jgi:hypothetical protein
MTKSVQSKIDQASDYLDRAPKVVRVAVDLTPAAFEPVIGVPDEGRSRLTEFQTSRGLGGSVPRVLSAMDDAAKRVARG